MLLENSSISNPNTTQTPSFNFSQLGLKAEIQISGMSASLVYNGTRVGNFCYVLITNSSQTVTANVKIYCYDVKTDPTIEWGAICYFTST